MGQGRTYKCNKCGYEFNAWIGAGFLYPVVCEENTEKAKKGELGEDLKKFFKDHPDGKIDCSKIVVGCERCGDYDGVLDLGMYIPENKKINKAIWSLDGYKKIGTYNHICQKCSGRMKTIKPNNNGNYDLTCPVCGDKLDIVKKVYWD